MHYVEYRKHDGVALAELVREGEVSPGELLEAAISRAAAVNGRINAITATVHDHARERAEQSLSGALAGVPFLLKDLNQEWATLPPSSGSRSGAGRRLRTTSVVTQRWLEAGLVVFGRTNSPEFGAKSITEPAAFGPSRNPWDPTRTPGGSSGGAAAAVAAGIVPVAAASDGGGSIRIPAAHCGLFGLKVGRGLTPAGPERGESWHGAAVDGVVSRSVRDSAVALDAIVGPDRAGPYTAAPPERPLAEEVEREPGRLRIGFTAESALGDPHPHAVQAMHDAVELLTAQGHDVQPVPAPVDLAQLARDFLQGWSVKLAASIDEMVAATGAPPERFELDTRLLAAVGRSISGPEYLATIERWHRFTRALAAFHDRHDLLLTPSLATPPLKVGALETPPALRKAGQVALALRAGGLLRRSGLTDRVARENLQHVPYTQLANLTGRPAMSVPLYWTPDGLPLGVQLVGPLAGEGMLVRLAAQLERARPWADREPPL